jgi:BirA family biotin operon repressor/biotin-[acetyl-CoA-carboxylase] ligase
MDGRAMSPTDLNKNEIERQMSGRLVGRDVLLYDVLGSTMDEARRLAEEGTREGTVVIAEEQTAGRGRFGRTWVSSPGQDLSFSVLLRPSAAQLPYVNMAATLAVSGAVEQVTGITPAIKWPNDVRLNGRKVSGILIETVMAKQDLKYAVLGIGVNVNLDLSEDSAISAIATSLSHETGRRVGRSEVIVDVLERLDELYREVKSGQVLTERWAARLDTLGRTVQVRWQDQVFEGRASGVDEQGNLVLARPDGSTVTVVAGEVTLQI